MAQQTSALLSVSDQVMTNQPNGDASLTTDKKRERETTKETDPLQVYVNTLGVDALLPLFTAMNFERAMPDSSTMRLRNQICAFAKTAAPDDPINYIKDLDLGMATIDKSKISSSPCKPPSKKVKVTKDVEYSGEEFVSNFEDHDYGSSLITPKSTEKNPVQHQEQAATQGARPKDPAKPGTNKGYRVLPPGDDPMPPPPPVPPPLVRPPLPLFPSPPLVSPLPPTASPPSLQSPPPS